MWKRLVLAHKHDTILRTLSPRRTARAGSALLGRPGRLDCLVSDRMEGLPFCHSCLAVVHSWKNIVCLSETTIDPAIYGGAEVVADVVDSVVVARYNNLGQEVGAAIPDRNSPTSWSC